MRVSRIRTSPPVVPIQRLPSRSSIMAPRPAAPVQDAAAVGGPPEAAVPVVRERPDPVARQPVAGREARDLLSLDAKQPPSRRGDVDRAVGSRVKLADPVRTEDLGVK